MTNRAKWVGVSVAAAFALGIHGCNGLENKEIPALSGPSELSLSLRLQADPDFVVANNGDASANGRASVIATLRGPDGSGVGGRTIVFNLLNQSGLASDQGHLRTPGSGSAPNGVKTELAVTDGGGNARLVYWSPARTDYTADGSVLIGARPTDGDANSALYRTVRVEVRSAEPRTFPSDPNNTPPLCNFAVQPFPGPYRAGTEVLFQSLGSDPDPGGFIVRYDWEYGDNSGHDDEPDVNHVWRFPGNYLVTHTVTDNVGAQTFCTFAITIS
jgi:hypothetical protein